MTLNDLMNRNPLYITAGAKTAAEDAAAMNYFFQCVGRFYSGDYGAIPPEDIAANNAELAAGEGRILARYEAGPGLKEGIFIIAYFSDKHPESNDFNYTTICYISDY